MNLLFIVLDATMDFGLTVSIVGFGIVLFALAVLFILFSRIPKIINLFLKKKKAPTNHTPVMQVPESADGIEGNVTAALSLALHLYFNEMHDEESNVVTIKQVRRAYSPWSSKIYGVTNRWPRG